ncbi:hypothetical protein BH23ACT5_BH23ACT5_07720 [soil metagenome]
MEQIAFTRIPLHARRSAVSRVDTSPHLLEMLASDPDPDVRLGVARHPATPVLSLQRLAVDAVARVAAVARIRVAAERVVAEAG